ncbi:MAG: gluconate 2-dehydrogenase subunit 3 family protein [Chloroflexi bacterium]|nr:gluconate 2-dehydrogenase subunit 3 family protein [Chloroflexota bacterium]MDA1219870.1 gluconate 2-dehydrogenase subunit 3 family protein [Chloroflexota bacterium]
MTVVFTEAQQSLLTSALNRIIPADGKMPGAGDLGLIEFVEEAVAPDPKLRRLVNDGLAQIAISASLQSGQEFSELGKDGQNAVLKEVQSQQPAFFDFLLRQCYNGYYTNPQIQDLIGYELPAPAEYEYKPFDESLLEPQRQRAPFWTQV